MIMNKHILMRFIEDAIDELPLTQSANDIMEAEDFRQYISQNGYHFNCKLADFVTKSHLVNANGTQHNWTSAQVKAALGMPELPPHITWGDAAYLANWIYSDNVPEPYATDADVIVATKRYMKDKDGYDGMVFMRFLTDMIGRHQNVDWSEFL